MKEKLNKWLMYIYEQWWKVVVIYFSACSSAYLLIWALIEPLNLPSEVSIFGISTERVFLHIASAILIGSHLVLLLSIIALRQLQIRILEPSIASNGEMLLSEILPARNQLTYERILMKDRKITRIVFASRVLLAINGESINEKMAKDLLYGSGYKLQEVTSKIYSLAIDNKRY